MAIESRKLSGQNPRLTINLNEMFGQRVPDSEAFRQSVGQQVIDRIRERTTQQNIDRRNRAFRGYSESYKRSLEFRAAGKSEDNVNLTLTGEMLGLMDIVDSSSSTITIGFTERDDQQKAHGHITGSKKGPGVRRDFFGLPENDYEELVSERVTPEPGPEEPGLLLGLSTLAELF